MENERDRKPEDQVKELDNIDVTEVEDQDLEDVSGGTPTTGNNFNCGCG